MPKALCIFAMVIAALVLFLFLADLLLYFLGMPDFAPFQGAAWGMDLFFIAGAALLGTLSYFTWKEQN